MSKAILSMISRLSGTSDAFVGRVHAAGRLAGALLWHRRNGAALVFAAVGAVAGFAVVLAQAPPGSPSQVRILAQTPTVSTTRGPQPSITCPAGAINIAPGTRIQTVVNSYAGNTTFCLRAGVHPITAPIVPKTGNTFVGEYGAILDGSTWKTSVDYEAAFMAHLQDIDDVTIRNLVIRNMPQRGIHAFYLHSDRWIIEHNEITGCRSGVSPPNGSIVRRNYIHRNNGDSKGGYIPNGGYIASDIRDVLFEENEIAHNGGIQKVLLTTNVTFRNDYLHHNGNGIWYDGDNVGALIEGNLVEDTVENGIFYEISGRGIIRNNIVRRSGESGIFMSTSRDVEIYGNTLEHNWRGVNLFVSCQNVYASANQPYAGAIGWDLRNNLVRDNKVVVGTRTWSIGNLLGYDATCSSTQIAPYLNGSKNNVFRNNTYVVPSLTGSWWMWGDWKTWTQWRALGQDPTGTASQ